MNKTKYVGPCKLPANEECFHGLFGSNEEAQMAYLIVRRCQQRKKWTPFFVQDICRENNLDISFEATIQSMYAKGFLMQLKDGSFLINGKFLELFS